VRLEHWLYTIPLRVRSIFRRTKVEQELEEELRFHLEHRIAQEMAAGKTLEDARYAALRAMGGIEQCKEECRDMRHVNFIDNLIRDLRYGLRVLRKNPAFTAMAILTLTLGIGANTAIFSVVNAVLLRPLPYPTPDQLVRIYETNISITDSHDSVSAPNFSDWRAQARSFSGMTALRWEAFTLTGGAEPEFLFGQRVTPDMLNILGVRPVLGRDFSGDDAIFGQDHVVLLSHELWTRRFAGDQSIIGRQIKLNFESYTVIGVLPPGFRTPSQFRSSDPLELLLPLTFTNAEMQNRGAHNSQVFARLRPTVTPAQAQVEMEAIAERLARTYSNNQGRGVRVIPLLDDVVGNYRGSLLIIFAAAGLILLISCANLANALLARGVGQQQEIAVRLALGASRIAIIRQVLVQNLILAAFGCACGVLTAFWVLKGLQALAPSTLPRINEVSVNGDTLAFAAGASILTGLSFGLLTALQLSSSRPYDAMKGRGATAASYSVIRWRDGFVVAQVALSLVLLVGAGLLLKSFANLRGIKLGFQPSSTLAMKIILPRTKYPEQTQRLQFFATLADRVNRMAGVEAVGYTNQLPMRGGWGGSFRVEHPEVPMGPNDDSDFQIVSSDYFKALRIRLLRGRLFSDLDRPDSEPIVIVNNAFARRYWPKTDPIGQRLTKGNLLFSIAGVVDDVHLEGPTRPANIEIYFLAVQAQSLPVSPSDFAVRTAGDPLSLISAIRREVWALDREQPVTAIRTMEEVLGQNTSATRFNTLLLAVFAGLALLLAAVGVYGIVSYSIAQRSPEIGIRMAVGARPADILGLILRQIASRIAIGALLGIAASLALSRYAAGMLFGVAPRDPATFAIAISVLVVASLIAALIPAGRAMRIDPIIVLRVD
jgi:putative ABC transport system permease protein